MDIKACSECNMKPVLMSDDFDMIFSYECPACGKRTRDIACPTSSIDKPQLDEETKNRLVEQWNSMN